MRTHQIITLFILKERLFSESTESTESMLSVYKYISRPWRRLQESLMVNLIQLYALQELYSATYGDTYPYYFNRTIESNTLVINPLRYQHYSPTKVSGKVAAETGGFRRRFRPPFSQDAKPSRPPASTTLGKPDPPHARAVSTLQGAVSRLQGRFQIPRSFPDSRAVSRLQGWVPDSTGQAQAH
jgi:hypothetical protein